MQCILQTQIKLEAQRLALFTPSQADTCSNSAGSADISQAKAACRSDVQFPVGCALAAPTLTAPLSVMYVDGVRAAMVVCWKCAGTCHCHLMIALGLE